MPNKRFLLIGILFSATWASASIAGKFGLRSAEPLVLFVVRFFLAGSVLLIFAYLLQKNRLPTPHEWKQLMIFALLNTTLYLGLFILGLQQVSGGIGSLSTATNPLFISLMSSILLHKPLKNQTLLGLFLGMTGVGLATFPLLVNAHTTWQGLVFMLFSMISYSAGTIYYSQIEWQLPRTIVNGWQVLLGGTFLLPLMFFLHKVPNNFNTNFWLAETWLVLVVSVLSVQLWLLLLKIDAIKAAFWLFLCPIFGFLLSYTLLQEPISWHTAGGTALVLAGLALGQQK